MCFQINFAYLPLLQWSCGRKAAREVNSGKKIR